MNGAVRRQGRPFPYHSSRDLIHFYKKVAVSETFTVLSGNFSNPISLAHGVYIAAE
jgi:hypothetical protein